MNIATEVGPRFGNTAQVAGISLTSDSGLLVLLKIVVDKAKDEGRLVEAVSNGGLRVFEMPERAR